MCQITVLADPARIADVKQYQLPPGQTLADWFIDRYGPDGFPVPTAVFIDGIKPHCQIDINDFETVNVRPDGPVYVIHRPQGLDPFTLAVVVAVAVVAAVAVGLLMPVPDLSGTGRQQRKSPNNALSGQTNIARPLDRVPEPFGEVVSYPDLIAPTVTEYIAHIKYQIEYMAVGRGFYLLEDFKSGSTLISDIAGSELVVYEPGTAPAEILKTRQSNEVSGQLMIGPNEEAVANLTGADTVAYTAGPDDEAVITAPATTFDAFEVGMTVDLREVWANDGASDFNLSGTYTVSGQTTSTLTLEQVTADNANWSNFTSTPTAVLTTTGGNPLAPVVEVPGLNPLIGPFTVPGDDVNNEVWLDLSAPKGLVRGEDFNKLTTVDLQFTFEEIDESGEPTGPSFVYPITVEDANRNARFWTFKVGVADGLVLDTRYRVTGERLTDSQPATLTRLDDITWIRLAGIEDITADDTSGTTRVVVQTRATQQVAALQERQFNVRATRKVVTWNGTAVVGNIETGVDLTPSRRMADALLHYVLDPKLGARTLSAIDVNALYAVQGRLDLVFDGEKGEFSYTFDNRDTPALEEMRLIAQAARCFLYREGSEFSIIRDEAQPVARGLINRRNKLPDAETRTVSFSRPLDSDGVQLEYDDIEDGVTRTITLPDDLPSTDENYGAGPAVNPLKVDGAGIRQYAQAWDRAQYEYRRLIYKRVGVESTVSLDGALYPLNSRIHHVDGTRLVKLESDGEVLAVDGLNVYTSEPCEFKPGEVYSVTLRNEEGVPVAPIRVNPLPSYTGRGFTMARHPGFDITVRGSKEGYQRGTLYSFGPDGNDLAQAYLLQRKTPDSNGNVRLELINYADEYFLADDRTPPAKV